MEALKIIVALPFKIIILALKAFFLPYSIVVHKRQYYPGPKSPTIMFLLILAFGWTVIGWVILLVIAQAMPD
jgi:hypothetical protein